MAAIGINGRQMEPNASQARAIDCRGHCVVAAGPGSGKTAMLVEKAERLTKEGVAPERIMLAAFNREAAAEMQRRIAKRVGERRANRLRIGTYHSLALKELSDSGTRLRIAKTGQVRAAVTAARKKRGVTYEEAKEAIETAKVALDSSNVDPEQQALAEIYTRELRARNLFDFFDILRICLEGMRDGRVQRWDLEALLADEYQDTDELQHAWLKQHIEAGAVMTVVGDDDQSIYGWRRAQGYAGLRDLVESFEAEVIALDTNYRCPENLVRASMGLIGKNAERIEKRIVSGRSGECEIFWAEAESPSHEASLIAEAASQLPLAVLSRSRAYLDEIEMTLALAGINYVRKDGSTVLSHPVFRRLIDFCRMAERPNLRLAQSVLRRVEIDRHHWRKIAEEFHLEEDPAYFMLDEEAPEMGTGHEIERLAQYFRDWHKTQQIYPLMAYRAILSWLTDHEDDELWRERLDRIAHMVSEEDLTLGQVATQIEALLLKAVGKGKDDGEEDPWVTLTTIHQAKGMTYDYVWVPGLADWHFPVKSADLAEERRLLYVAMTRAREALTITAVPGDRKSLFCDDLNDVLGEKACLASA